MGLLGEELQFAISRNNFVSLFLLMCFSFFNNNASQFPRIPQQPMPILQQALDVIGFLFYYYFTIVSFLTADGAWAQWGPWAQCSSSCGLGNQSRTRNCTNPAPSYGGEDCIGPRNVIQICNVGPCPGKMV